MNRQAVNTISDEALKALEAVAAKHGLALKRESGRFEPSAGTFTAKFTFVCKTETGVPSDFTRNAPLYGLKASDWGREFRTFRGTYTICGIKPRARKYPILGKCTATGQTYKFPKSVVQLSFKS